MGKEYVQPLVSIITVCYNSEKYIRNTIESVLNQTYNNIEYIIIDGDSTDNTINIIKEYEPKFNGRMRWISEPDDGIYNAMNKGIKFSDSQTNDFLFFLNSGDYFIDIDIVDKVIKIAKVNNLDFIYGDIMNGENRINNNIKYNLKLLFTTICHQAIFAKKKCFGENYFDEGYNWLADYKWILNCYKNQNIKKGYINEIISYFDPNNNTGLSNYKLELKRLKEREQIGKEIFSGFKKYIFLLNNFRLLTKLYIKKHRR